MLFSCGNESKMKKDLSKLMSNSITLPYESIITVRGKDSLVANYFKSDYKMIIYIDSAVRASCGISKMFLWESFVYNN